MTYFEKGLKLIKPITRKLIGFLYHTDQSLRDRAAEALSSIGDPEAVIPLSDILLSQKQNDIIPIALASFKDPNVNKILIKFFKESSLSDENLFSGATSTMVNSIPESEFSIDPTLKPGVATALSAYKDEKTIETLIEGLNDLDPNVRCSCITSLGKLKAYSAVSPLLGCLSESNEWLFQNTIQSLTLIGDKKATTPLINFYTKERNPVKRSMIISALGGIRDLGAVSLLTRALQDDDSRVKANAIDALAELNLPSEKIIPLLKPYLTDNDNRVKGNAARALAKLDCDDALITLSEMKNSPDKRLRSTLAWILSDVKLDNSVTMLIDLIRDSDKEVRNNAAYSLDKQVNESHVGALIRLLEDKQPFVRFNSAKLLEKLKVKSSSRWIASMYRTEKDLKVRIAAIKALGEVGSAEQIQIVVDASKDKEASLRSAAAISLAKIAEGPSAMILKGMLKDPDTETRASAAAALFSLGHIDVIKHISKMLNSTDLSIKTSAILASNRIGSQIKELDLLPLASPLKVALDANISLNKDAEQRTFNNLPTDLILEPKNITKPSSNTLSEIDLNKQKEDKSKIIELSRSGKTSQAFILAENYLKKNPNDLQILRFSGGTAFSLKEFDKAVNFYKKASILNPFDAVILNSLGTALFRAGHPVEASESLLSALKLQPSYSAARFSLANIYMKLNKFSEAVRHFEEGLRYDKPTAAVLNNLAYSYGKIGRLDKSIEIYRRVISINPDDSGAYYNLSILLIKKGKQNIAKRLIGRALYTIKSTSPGYESLKILLKRISQ